MYGFGVVGNMGGGLLDFIATNWIPLGQKSLANLCSSSCYRIDFLRYLFRCIQIFNLEI